MQNIDSTKILRYIFKNPNGIQLSDPSTEQGINEVQSEQVSVMGWGGIDLNMGRTETKSKLYTLTKIHCTQSKTQFSHLNDSSIPFKSEYQAGGTLTMTNHSAVGRIVESGQDPFNMGRWSWVTLQGKSNKTITIITAYCPGKGTLNNKGILTSWRQQYRYQLQSTSKQLNPPHEQTLIDLAIFIRDRRARKNIILLGIDANQYTKANEITQYIPINEKDYIQEYKPTMPQRTGSNIRNLSDFIRWTGLTDLVSINHGDKGPNTYIHQNGKAIDFILGSNELIDKVTSIGYTPSNKYIAGDHRGIFVDIPTLELFGHNNETLAPTNTRNLTIEDPGVVDKYVEILERHLRNQNIFQKMKNLQTSSNFSPTEIEIIDKGVTDACRIAENKCRIRNGRDKWFFSPTFQKIWATCRYWKLLILQKRGHNIKNETIEKQRTKAQIKEHLPKSMHEYCSLLKKSYKEKRSIQKKHKTLKEEFVENLITRIALKIQETKMLPDTMLPIIKERALKERMNKIKSKYFWERIRSTVGKKVKHPLVRLDIKNDNNETISITDKNEIFQKVLEYHRHHFTKANNTPLGSPSMTRKIGIDGCGKLSENILGGKLNPSEIEETTREFMKFLNDYPKQCPIPTTILTQEQYTKMFKKKKLRKTSSPSGRHYGHYIAVLDHPNLIQLYLDIINICIKHGYSLERWRNIVEIVIPKKVGQPLIHRLRIIQILEGDFQFMQKFTLCAPLMNQCEKNNKLHHIQKGGRAGKMATSCILQKKLVMDFSILTKFPLAIIDTDISACFDNILPGIALLLARIMGISKPIAKVMGHFYRFQKRTIRTGHGTTNEAYSGNGNENLSGLGQGSIFAVYGWILFSSVLFEFLSTKHEGATFENPERTLKIKQVADAFIDDTTGYSLMKMVPPVPNFKKAMMTQINQTMEAAEKYTTDYSQCLYGNAHPLNHDKEYAWLVTYQWTGGRSYMRWSTKERPILQYSTKGTTYQLKCLKTTSAQKSLGIHLSPSSCYAEQLKKMTTWSRDIGRLISHSNTRQLEAITCLNMCLLPKLTYPLVVTSFNEKQCIDILKPALILILPKLQINRNISRDILHGATKLGGMQIKHLFAEQAISQIKHIIGHIRKQDETGKLIQISMETQQLIAGTTEYFWNLPFEQYTYAQEPTLLTSLWRFFHCFRKKGEKITIEFPSMWRPKLNRVNDASIMEEIVTKNPTLTTENLMDINACRLYLQVSMISEIVTADGKTIENWALTMLKSHRKSTLRWPIQQRPPYTKISLWKRTIVKTLLIKSSLTTPLGLWNEKPHQEWKYFITQNKKQIIEKKKDSFQIWNKSNEYP